MKQRDSVAFNVQEARRQRYLDLRAAGRAPGAALSIRSPTDAATSAVLPTDVTNGPDIVVSSRPYSCKNSRLSVVLLDVRIQIASGRYRLLQVSAIDVKSFHDVVVDSR